MFCSRPTLAGLRRFPRPARVWTGLLLGLCCELFAPQVCSSLSFSNGACWWSQGVQQESRIRILGSVASRALFQGHLQGHLKASSRTPSRSPRGHLQGILGSVASRALLKKNCHEASSRTPCGNADPMFGPVARPDSLT